MWKVSGKDSPSHSRPGVGETFSKGITTMVRPIAVWPITVLPGVGASSARSDSQKSRKATKMKTAAGFTTSRLYRLGRRRITLVFGLGKHRAQWLCLGSVG